MTSNHEPEKWENKSLFRIKLKIKSGLDKGRRVGKGKIETKKKGYRIMLLGDRKRKEIRKYFLSRKATKDCSTTRKFGSKIGWRQRLQKLKYELKKPTWQNQTKTIQCSTNGWIN